MTRSYIVEQTEPLKRTYTLARLSALQYAGFSMTPIFGAILVFSGSLLSSFWTYALPPILIVLLGLICVVLLIKPFQDIQDEMESPMPAISIPVSVSVVSPLHSTTDEEVATEEKVAVNEIGKSNSKDRILEPYQASSQISRKPISSSSAAAVMPQPLISPSSSSSSSASASSIITDRIKSYFGNMFRPANAIDLAPEVAADLQATYLLLILLNFTTRGAIAVYETQSSSLLLSFFGLSNLGLGAVVTTAGTIGTLNLVFFKQLWSSRYTDLQLMLGGFALMGIPNFLVMQFGNQVSCLI